MVTELLWGWLGNFQRVGQVKISKNFLENDLWIFPWKDSSHMRTLWDTKTLEKNFHPEKAIFGRLKTFWRMTFKFFHHSWEVKEFFKNSKKLFGDWPSLFPMKGFDGHGNFCEGDFGNFQSEKAIFGRLKTFWEWHSNFSMEGFDGHGTFVRVTW